MIGPAGVGFEILTWDCKNILRHDDFETEKARPEQEVSRTRNEVLVVQTKDKRSYLMGN